MAETESHLDQDKLTEPFPKLLDLASNRVGLSIWCNYINRSQSNRKNNSDQNEEKEILDDVLIENFGFDGNYREECEKQVEYLNIPRTITGQVRMSLLSVINNMEAWVLYFKEHILSYRMEEYRIKSLKPNWCVWLSNGEICYRKTVLKMLTLVELSEVQKFALFSHLCMEDEIRTIRENHLPSDFMNRMDLNHHALLCYWFHYLRNTLPVGPISLNALMFEVASQYTGDWLSFMHFWRHLHDDKPKLLLAKRKCVSMKFTRFQITYHLTPAHVVFPHQLKLFSIITSHQQHHLISKIPAIILANFWLRLESLKYVFWAWKRAKEYLTDVEFASLVTTVFCRGGDCDYKMNVLLSVWDSASDSQRNYATQTIEDEIIRRLGCTRKFSSINAVIFLHRFLSTRSAEYRKRVILENALKFNLHKRSPSAIGQVLDLFLPSVDDQLHYKIMVLNSDDMRNYCVKLFNDAEFERLNRILFFHSPDSMAFRDFKIRLLFLTTSVCKYSLFDDVEKFNEMTVFLDGVFPNTHSWHGSAVEFQKHMILSYLHQRRYFDYSLNEFSKMARLLDILELNFDPEATEHIKTTLKNSFISILKGKHEWWRSKFSEKIFQKIRISAFNGDRDDIAVQNFLQIIPVDVIFDAVFTENYAHFPSQADSLEFMLVELDKVLLWYLNTDAEKKKYKTRKAYDNIRVFRSFINRTGPVSMMKLLIWFFDRDQAEIQKFLMMNADIPCPSDLFLRN